MKIAVISSTVFALGNNGLQGYGGLEQIAWLCAKGLAEKGHQVSLVAPDGSSCPGVEIIPCGPAGQVSEEMAFGGFPEIKEGEVIRRREHAGYWQHLLKCDAVVDHSWQKYSYMLKMEGTLKCPVLGVLHAPVNSMYQTLPPIDNPCFVCISIDHAEHFKALFNRDARCCYNGVSSEFYKPLDVPRTDRFLFLARFSSIKGPDLAIQACKEAGVGLDVIGDFSITNEPELYERCKEMADGKQIRIVGPASRGECVWWMSQAHAFLHPNQRFREPMGLAPVEAQLCGLPVIAWDFGAMRETVKDKTTGYLVRSYSDLVNAVRAVKQNPFYMGGSREGCRQWAEQFSIQRMVDTYESLCQEAVEGGW